MRYLPYAVGGFMLLPFAIWLAFWSLFPGPKHGLDVPLVSAMLATSMPLVLWFFVANLGFLANSIGGGDQYDRPDFRPVRGLVALLPWAALALGVLSQPFLFLQGEVNALMPMPLLTGAAIFFAIRRGEKARAADSALCGPQSKPQNAPAEEAPARPSTLARLGGFCLKLVYAVPLVGWLIEDAVKGRESAKLFLALNVFILAAAAVAVFGYPALIVMALALVPIVFAGIFWTTWA